MISGCAYQATITDSLIVMYGLSVPMLARILDNWMVSKTSKLLAGEGSSAYELFTPTSVHFWVL